MPGVPSRYSSGDRQLAKRARGHKSISSRRKPVSRLKGHMLWAYLKRSFGFWFAGFFALMSSVPAIVSLGAGWKAHRDRQDFYPTQATVIEKYTQKLNHGRDYVVRFGYLDRDERPHQATATVPAKEWDGYREGHSVDVYVSGADPDDAWLETEGEPSYVSAVVGIGI